MPGCAWQHNEDTCFDISPQLASSVVEVVVERYNLSLDYTF